MRDLRAMLFVLATAMLIVVVLIVLSPRPAGDVTAPPSSSPQFLGGEQDATPTREVNAELATVTPESE